jgi:hypothetical protein
MNVAGPGSYYLLGGLEWSEFTSSPEISGMAWKNYKKKNIIKRTGAVTGLYAHILEVPGSILCGVTGQSGERIIYLFICGLFNGAVSSSDYTGCFKKVGALLGVNSPAQK